MPNLAEELDRIKELLSPTGILYIALPGIYYIHDTYRGNLMEYLQNAHIWYFTLKTLNSTLAKSNFQLVTGNETIIAVYKIGASNQKLELENSEKVLYYLKKTENLRWYYALLAFSPKHEIKEFLLKMLRKNDTSYFWCRNVYRKYFINYEKDK